MAVGITGMWDLISSFIGNIALSIRVNFLEAILIALFDQFFTFLFVTLSNSTIGFMIVFTTFMLIFYWKYIHAKA